MDLTKLKSRRELLFSKETFLWAKPGDFVKVHLNLGIKWKAYKMKTWCVKKKGSDTTIGHTPSIILEDATFVVQPSGNKKARETGEKTVHAFVCGTYTNPDNFSVRLSDQVRYNPHIGMEDFCIEREGKWETPIYKAPLAVLNDQWEVWVP